jgi:hypothetical protein
MSEKDKEKEREEWRKIVGGRSEERGIYDDDDEVDDLRYQCIINIYN